MTKKQAINDFKQFYTNGIDVENKHAVNQAWVEYTDRLCKQNDITELQYMNWVTPTFNNKTITVKNVNVLLLRQQVNALTGLSYGDEFDGEDGRMIDGMVCLLETMIDISEGKV